MAEKPIFTTPGGKKIMTLSAAKAYYESKRNPSKKGAKTFTQFINEMKSKNKVKLPKFPKRKNKPKLPGRKSKAFSFRERQAEIAMEKEKQKNKSKRRKAPRSKVKL
tara:strand:- start:131 stop:451 length:321 start_codon:yes stop_codon:yes gene_type:complete